VELSARGRGGENSLVSASKILDPIQVRLQSLAFSHREPRFRLQKPPQSIYSHPKSHFSSPSHPSQSHTQIQSREANLLFPLSWEPRHRVSSSSESPGVTGPSFP
ncbi:hypothetical protein F2P56_010509, partial [Juglans regia]